MPSEGQLLLCYNRGCGKSFDPDQNEEDSCAFHPGAPVFHDAYKGWSCCKKKCTDFTEFLNIKGCTTSYHNSVKPPEPEKPVVDKSKADEVIEYKAPQRITEEQVVRPPFDTPTIKLIPTVRESLRTEVAALRQNSGKAELDFDGTGEVPIGTACKNNGCSQTYAGSQSLSQTCNFHPGVPIFHEGMKFWSCCTKRTTDFNSFLQQVGCNTGLHVWFKPKVAGTVKCRLDWHQTPSFVYVTIFARKYDPDLSSVHLSPVRLKVTLVFPEDEGRYEQDIELRGVVNVEESSVQMIATKVEIKLRKTRGSNWPQLEIPRPAAKPTPAPEPPKPVVTLEEQVDAVDLSDL